MAYCTTCGAQRSGDGPCGACGAPAPAGRPTPPAAPPAGPPIPPRAPRPAGHRRVRTRWPLRPHRRPDSCPPPRPGHPSPPCRRGSPSRRRVPGCTPAIGPGAPQPPAARPGAVTRPAVGPPCWASSGPDRFRGAWRPQPSLAARCGGGRRGRHHRRRPGGGPHPRVWRRRWSAPRPTRGGASWARSVHRLGRGGPARWLLDPAAHVAVVIERRRSQGHDRVCHVGQQRKAVRLGGLGSRGDLQGQVAGCPAGQGSEGGPGVGELQGIQVDQIGVRPRPVDARGARPGHLRHQHGVPQGRAPAVRRHPGRHPGLGRCLRRTAGEVLAPATRSYLPIGGSGSGSPVAGGTGGPGGRADRREAVEGVQPGEGHAGDGC